MNVHQELYDVLIVGGGPSGLSAALVLGRSRRKVLLCDSGRYRNSVSKAMHGFVTRDGTSPEEFRRVAHEELKRYPSVTVAFTKVIDIVRNERDFAGVTLDEQKIKARKVILATGIVDELPEFEGARDVFGQGLFLCPYCDGWEVQDQPLCIYGKGDSKGAGMALEMTLWSRDLVLCTDGPAELSEEYKKRLDKFKIKIDERKVRKLAKNGEGLLVSFEDGEPISCRAMFFNTSSRIASDLAEKLGCEIVEQKDVRRSEKIAGKTCVPGVYMIGDASRDVLQVIVAAGEGSAAAIALNNELLRDDGVL